MSKKSKKNKSNILLPIIIGIIVVIIIGIIVWGITTGWLSKKTCIARGVTDDKILFGTSLPLTGSLSALGEDAILALKATKRRINEGGGIHGRMIDFIVKDDAYDSEKTVENSKYFIEKENVFAIWGGIGSTTTKAAIPVHDNSNTPTLFPWSVEHSFNDVNKHPLFFSIIPSSYNQAKSFGDYTISFLENKFGKDKIKVGLMSVNAWEGDLLVKGYNDSTSGELLVEEQTWDRDASSYIPQITKFKESEVTDLYVDMTSYYNFSQFIKEIKELELEARIYVSSFLVNQDTIEISGKISEGLSEGLYGIRFLSSPLIIDGVGKSSIDIASNPNKWLSANKPGINAYRDDMVAVGATEVNLTESSLVAYTGGLVLEEMLKRAGPCLTVENLVKAGESIKDFDTGGITRPLNFDSNDHLGNHIPMLLQVKNGVWKEIGNK